MSNISDESLIHKFEPKSFLGRHEIVSKRDFKPNVSCIDILRQHMVIECVLDKIPLMYTYRRLTAMHLEKSLIIAQPNEPWNNVLPGFFFFTPTAVRNRTRVRHYPQLPQRSSELPDWLSASFSFSSLVFNGLVDTYPPSTQPTVDPGLWRLDQTTVLHQHVRLIGHHPHLRSRHKPKLNKEK